MPININYCSDETLACHYTDDYFSFLFSKYYWGFCHMFFSFMAVVLSSVGMRPRSAGILMTSFWVLFVGTLFSIFQDISVAIHASGSKLPPWTEEWEAGDQTFDLLWNVIGASFGALFLYMANPCPNTCFGVARLRKGWTQMMHWMLAAFIHIIVIPLLFIVGGLLVLHISALVDMDSVFRVDFLVFVIYCDLCMGVYWILRRNFEIKHITSCFLLLGGDMFIDANNKTENLMQHITQNEKGEEEFVPTTSDSTERSKLPKAFTEQCKKRVDAEMILLFVTTNVWFLMQLFVMLDRFYLQPLISIVVALVVFILVRVLMGISALPTIQQYARPFVPASGYSATGTLPVVGF